MKLFGYTPMPRRQFLKLAALVSAVAVGIMSWQRLFRGRRSNTRGLREAKYYRNV